MTSSFHVYTCPHGQIFATAYRDQTMFNLCSSCSDYRISHRGHIDIDPTGVVVDFFIPMYDLRKERPFDQYNVSDLFKNIYDREHKQVKVNGISAAIDDRFILKKYLCLDLSIPN